jgi:hypothetical protein
MARNITLAIDDETLDAVRVYAANHKTTVNGLVRDFLGSLAAQEDKTVRARRRLRELMDRSALEAGPVTWARDDLHDR